MISFFYTGNSQPNLPQDDIYRSLGGFVSTTEITSGNMQNVFDMISAYGVSTRTYPRYVCIAMRNTGLATLSNVRFWFEPTGTQIMSEYRAGFIMPNGDGVLQSSPNVTTKPNMVQFDPATALVPNVLGNITPGMTIGVWLERRITTVEFDPVLPYDLIPKTEGVELVFEWD